MKEYTQRYERYVCAALTGLISANVSPTGYIRYNRDEICAAARQYAFCLMEMEDEAQRREERKEEKKDV